MALVEETIHQYELHGMRVGMECTLPQLGACLRKQFAEFAVDKMANSGTGKQGFIGPYDAAQVLRHVSSNAVALTGIGFGREAYQDGERIWVVDDRCGLCEINYIKGQWRSWILEPALADTQRCVDFGFLWPMAQLLRIKGLHLVPGVSIATENFGALLLCPFGVLPELSAIAENGWRIIGQRWSALRISHKGVDLLHMPGGIDTSVWPRRGGGNVGGPEYFDLHAVYPESRLDEAQCSAVIVVSSGRRPQASANGLSRWEAGEVIRRTWPIAELHPRRRGGAMAAELGTRCQCVEARLSPRGEDILDILQSVREGRIGHGSGRLTLFVSDRKRARMAG